MYFFLSTPYLDQRTSATIVNIAGVLPSMVHRTETTNELGCGKRNYEGKIKHQLTCSVACPDKFDLLRGGPLDDPGNIGLTNDRIDKIEAVTTEYFSACLRLFFQRHEMVRVQ
jgi:hypothetical protein